MIINIIYITYYIDNLKFSLPAVNNINYDFNLIIHNDNPSVKLTEEWILENCGQIKYNSLTIVNEDINVGMLFSRINAFRASPKSDYTIFMDDDDYLLIKNLPNFDGSAYTKYLAYQVNSEEQIQNALKGVGKIGFSVNICAAFWKSDFISEVFSNIETNPPDFKINSKEDLIIWHIGYYCALKYRLSYMKQINEVGLIYVCTKDNHNKYNHINDPRYTNDSKDTIIDYNDKIDKYIINLRNSISCVI